LPSAHHFVGLAVYLSSQRVLQIYAERGGIKFSIARASGRTLSIVGGRFLLVCMRRAHFLATQSAQEPIAAVAAANFDRQHSFKLLQGRAYKSTRDPPQSAGLFFCARVCDCVMSTDEWTAGAGNKRKGPKKASALKRSGASETKKGRAETGE
jgi:hypothetical protein